MTPEERAAAVLAEVGGFYTTSDFDEATALVASAIRAAVEEERMVYHAVVAAAIDVCSNVSGTQDECIAERAMRLDRLVDALRELNTRSIAAEARAIRARGRG